jgi:ubiquinone/menaquinone biosynthesis C-methylase UbiE
MLIYLLLMLMMISFLILCSPSIPYSTETPRAIVPYSEEYVPLYELVTYRPERYHMELTYLQSRMSTSSHVLDVGSGLGYHVGHLNDNGISAVGLDSSKAMVHHAKQAFPQTYIHGNVMNASLFPEESFTHILCLYYTIYEIQDKETFFHNAHHWLSEKGTLVVHWSSQCPYGEPMVGDITYESTLHNTMLKEKIKYKQSYTVHHILYPLSKEALIHMAKKCHFRYVNEYPYAYHSLLTFQRETPTYDNTE